MRARILRIDRRASSWLIVAAVMAIGVAMMTGSLGALLDRGLMPERFAAMNRSASGRIAIVEMDADSAASIKRWPWSRSNYAVVVDRLRRAGAASIVFDVEFSSPSDEAGDRAFAAALARSDGLVALPTFGQSAGSNDRRTIDALPIPAFRDHVALASVSIRPDSDGQVRAMPFATITAGTPRPSLSSYIAARAGPTDTDFPIDMAIVPSSIPRLSFVAVRDGRFDPARVRGRNILIGATSVEMGDRYATPEWGVIPGVVVQALAAETLLRGMPSTGSPVSTFLFAALAVAVMASLRSTVSSFAVATGSAVALSIIVLIAQHWFQAFYPLAGALVMIAVAAIACLVRDVLDRFRTQRIVDEATGLPNARALLRIDGTGADVTLVAAHIDNFDALRAILGDRVAADVLIRVGERLALVAGGDAIYRTADNQLSFLLDAKHRVDASLDGLRAILLQPVEVGGRRVDAAISMGVANGMGTSIERLLADATIAAEDARRSGIFWSRAVADDEVLERSISLMGELDEAIRAGEIDVYYQPKYHLRDERIASVEALVRWRHPVRGFVGPDVFIPIAERANRIEALTLHVLGQVVRDLAVVRSTHPDVTAAVNISAKLLSAASFNEAVEAIIDRAGIPTAALVFEVTESAAMSDTAAAIAALHHYRDLGIVVSMDDYGTGQSTLTYIRQLPLSELKIDRSFVQFAHQNRDDAVLVRSTIALAHELGLKVVAEGVEDAECMAFLSAAGCDSIQGYLISKPVPLPALLTLLDDRYRYAA